METKSFNEKVFLCCSSIPKGKVSTYKQIAVKIASPHSARAVGNALNKNPHIGKIPCHRVVRSDGFVGGYVFGRKKKIKILEKEGVIVLDSGKIDLKKFGWGF